MSPIRTKICQSVQNMKTNKPIFLAQKNNGKKFYAKKTAIFGTFLHSNITKIFASRASTLKLICGYNSDSLLPEKIKISQQWAALRILALGKKIRFWPLFGNRPVLQLVHSR